MIFIAVYAMVFVCVGMFTYIVYFTDGALETKEQHRALLRQGELATSSRLGFDTVEIN